MSLHSTRVVPLPSIGSHELPGLGVSLDKVPRDVRTPVSSVVSDVGSPIPSIRKTPHGPFLLRVIVWLKSFYLPLLDRARLEWLLWTRFHAIAESARVSLLLNRPHSRKDDILHRRACSFNLRLLGLTILRGIIAPAPSSCQAMSRPRPFFLGCSSPFPAPVLPRMGNRLRRLQHRPDQINARILHDSARICRDMGNSSNGQLGSSLSPISARAVRIPPLWCRRACHIPRISLSSDALKKRCLGLESHTFW